MLSKRKLKIHVEVHKTDQIYHWEVKEMVKNCIQLPPKEGYETAEQMMHQLYGDLQRTTAAYCKEIEQ